MAVITVEAVQYYEDRIDDPTGMHWVQEVTTGLPVRYRDPDSPYIEIIGEDVETVWRITVPYEER